MRITVGCDPELFLKKGDTYIAGIGIVPGTKQKPHKLNKGAVQLDGLALEFNIDPAETKEEFTSNVETVLDQCKALVGHDIFLDPKPHVVFDPVYYDSLAEESKQLGCDPDYNAKTMMRNSLPQARGTIRTGAGHIHLGWTSGADPLDRGHFYDCCTLVNKMDAYFSIFKRFWDKDDIRQQMYGAAGAFRPKPYGLEYRVLSNAWIGEPRLWPWIFESTKWIFETALKNKEQTDAYFYPNTHTWDFQSANATRRKDLINSDVFRCLGSAYYPLYPIEEHIVEGAPQDGTRSYGSSGSYFTTGSNYMSIQGSSVLR